MSKGLAHIMKQAQMMQQRMAKLQEDAASKTVEAAAGGGAVTVVVTGKHQIVSLSIKKEAVDPEDVEMLQDLVKAAVNEAMAKVQLEMSEQMSKVTGGINIPGLF
ncbi:nucleoid-associated protein [Geobacter sp. OR-1]|uniref:YbaB/EbfC family nucleoid-associated protein n=1 Tax=Geobacter sp. OR-1 TaxID=1266765 RepID=UPI000543F00E|nr:YbaB/EbfC family nucleoid-associated protein [Geobacter sp. OR-1]GAM11299.1 nucleoid-associated protein [Geobacter sp. OR-1]